MTDRWESFGGIVDSEYDVEWQRKQSIETRSLALVTVNIALLTIVTLLSERLDLLGQLSDPCIRNLGLVSLVVYGVSTVAALCTALPFHYWALDPDGMDDILEELVPMTDEDSVVELLDMRINQLRQAREMNRLRARGLVAGYLAAVLATVLMASAFGWAIHEAPLP